jgi:hypothetical protein
MQKPADTLVSTLSDATARSVSLAISCVAVLKLIGTSGEQMWFMDSTHMDDM